MTFWNREPAVCRRVIVRVGKALRPTWWCADLEGQEHPAVEITYDGSMFFIDNEYGVGWRKVTLGQGAPFGPHSRHRSLPDDSVVLREAL